MVDVRVVGIGSPHGDDQAGWRFVELLQRKDLPNTDVVAVRGAVAVVDCLQECRSAILVDACRSGAEAGSITRLVWPDARVSLQHGRTTHGFGLASALELAQRLRCLPGQVVVYGVEAECCDPGTEMSPAVQAALASLVRRVLDDIEQATQVPRCRPGNREPSSAEEQQRTTGAHGVMNDKSVLETLRDVGFLRGIGDEYLNQIAEIAEREEFPEGKIIFHEGGPAQFIYLIVSGNVSLEIAAPGVGSRRILTVGVGELLGWSPVLEQARLAATARALTPTQVVKISGQQVLTMCEHNPRFGYDVMRRAALALAKRLSATRMQLIDVYGSQMPNVNDQTS
jgi:hydrogenase maturation protease